MFYTFRYFLGLRLWLNKFKLPGVLYFNPKSILLPPPDLTFEAVVGKGIKGRHYKEGEVPTKEEVAEAHASYV